MMDCSYCRLRYTCDKYAEALRTPTYITGCCTAFTFDTSCSDDAFAYRVRQPMTNGDRIRGMTDEELAVWLVLREAAREIDREVFITGYSTPKSILNRINALAQIAWLNWLKQPVEEFNDTD